MLAFCCFLPPRLRNLVCVCVHVRACVCMFLCVDVICVCLLVWRSEDNFGFWPFHFYLFEESFLHHSVHRLAGAQALAGCPVSTLLPQGCTVY